jgi:phosphoserine phosphatase RsbU/P
LNKDSINPYHQNEYKLKALLDITSAINENYSKNKLFELFEFILKNQLGLAKVILFIKIDNQWDSVLKFGTKGMEKKFDVSADLLHIKSITSIQSSSKEHVHAFDIAIPVYHKQNPLAFLLLGKGENQTAEPIDLDFILAMTNIISVAIENKRLAKENLKQELMNKELELASQMQTMLFPSSKELPNNEDIHVSALYKPHQQVGGDYYDFFKIREHEYAICLADVSGKGMPAALLMSNFQAHLRTILEFKPGLKELITELNKRVMHSAKGEKFITLFVGIYHAKKRTLNYINAAHNPPLLKNAENLYQLDAGCVGLGMFDEIPSIHEGLISVPKNSLLFCYTDGVTDLENEQNECFEVENLDSFINQNWQLNPQRFHEELLKTLENYKGNKPFTDDIALISCRFN